MAVEYRLVRDADIEHASAVEAIAADGVQKDHGFFQGRTDPRFDVTYFSFLMRKVPHAFWVAEDRGRVVGLSTSWVRDPLWFLADLFILPRYQGRGVGRTLIERTLGSWRSTKIRNRALITFAYNPTSISLYMRFDMYPREPLYFAGAPSDAIRERLKTTDKVEYQEVTDRTELQAITKRIEERSLGLALEWHHEYFLEVQKAKCFTFMKDGRAEGYAYVRENGRVGPIAVTPRLPLRDVMATTVSIAARQGAPTVVVLYSGSSPQQVSAALKCGLRIRSPMLFMSTRPVGNWENYVSYSPGLM